MYMRTRDDSTRQRAVVSAPSDLEPSRLARAAVEDLSISSRRIMASSATMKLIAKRVYLALGDSISIDDYTGVRGGGAPSQLARKLDVELVDLTSDGNTTRGVLADLARAPAAADVVTLTAGGNDLLVGDLPRVILRRLHEIAERIESLGTEVIVNTIYDPSDGDNDLGRRELGLSRLATIELRRRLNAVNGGIAKLAEEHGFLLADLERLFHGHGLASNEPWFVQVIEPNLAGATAIADHWYELLNVATERRDPRTTG
jgi:lysophospholipase L1-like esterase